MDINRVDSVIKRLDKLRKAEINSIDGIKLIKSD